MIITDVEALLLRPPGKLDATIADGSQDGLLIRVFTDEGVIGIGEVDSSPWVVQAAVTAPASHMTATGLRELLVGQDPADISGLWRRMYHGSLYYGRRGAALHAISGIDIALWDIAGKVEGKPIHELLGGRKRDRIRAYASTLMPDTPDEARRVACMQREAGFDAVKLGWGPLGRDADQDLALVRAAREGAGDDAELMIDIGLGWTDPQDAIQRAQRMEDYRPFWIEEPFMPDELPAYRALADAVTTPIAAGEADSTLLDFERLVDQGGVGIVQPDVTRAGGVTECMRIAEMARLRGRRCIPHAFSTGIIKAATLHVLAAMEKAEFMEYCVQTTPLSQRLVGERFPVVDGCVEVPQGAGLGIEIDLDYMERCVVKGAAS